MSWPPQSRPGAGKLPLSIPEAAESTPEAIELSLSLTAWSSRAFLVPAWKLWAHSISAWSRRFVYPGLEPTDSPQPGAALVPLVRA